MRMTMPVAILGAGVLIAAALLFGNRYEFAVVGDDIVRTDRLFGTVKECRSRSARVLSADREFEC
ncbi:MAG: hypothetical protein AAF667_05755 [Pseudomonadota bacterium]